MPTVYAPIIPGSDQYPVVDDQHVKGGYHVAATTAEMNSIPVALRKRGMRVVVSGDNREYTYDGTQFLPSDPVLTSPQLLTIPQRATARANIDAADSFAVPGTPWIAPKAIETVSGCNVPGGAQAGIPFGMTSVGPNGQRRINFVNWGNQGAAENSSLIRKVRLFVDADLPADAIVTLQWWRKEYDRWDLAFTTSDLRSLLTANGTAQTITLPKPFRQLIGDKIGGGLEYPTTFGAGFHAVNTPPAGGIYSPQQLRFAYDGTIEDGAPIDLMGVMPSPMLVPIELIGEPPVIACIGNSRLAGFPTGTSLFLPDQRYDRRNDIAFLLEQMTGLTTRNRGIESNTTALMSARFATDVIASNAKVAGIFISAYNDITRNSFGSNEEAVAYTTNNVKSMVDAALAAGMLVFVTSDWPFRILNPEVDINAYNALSDQCSNSVESLVAGYDPNRVAFIDHSLTMGVERTAPVTSYLKARNRWDLSEAFGDPDGVHHTPAGSFQSARNVAREVMRFLRWANVQLPQSTNPHVMYTTNPATELLKPMYPELPALALRVSGGEFKTWNVGTQAWV